MVIAARKLTTHKLVPLSVPLSLFLHRQLSFFQYGNQLCSGRVAIAMLVGKPPHQFQRVRVLRHDTRLSQNLRLALTE